MQKVEIEGLPETDRVFLLDSGDYVRSRFRHMPARDACDQCGSIRLGEGAPHLAVRITMALCDENGEVLRGESGPVFSRHFSFATPMHVLREKTRAELFSEAKEKALPFFEMELAVTRSFPEPVTCDDLC